jgi:hypothetical protein
MDADELDLEIDRILAGGTTDDPVLTGLALLARDVPGVKPAPPTAASTPGSLTLARLAAAVLAATMLTVGSTNLLFGEWLADWLDFAYDPHVFREGGLAYLVVGLVLAAGAWRPSYLLSGVLVGVPLGLTLGIHGILELTRVANPAAELMHVTQGVAAAVLGAAWLLPRRPNPRRTR